MNTYAETNLQTSDFRTLYRPAPATREQQIERIQRYLVEMACFSWTGIYAEQIAKLAELESAQ